MPIAQELWSQDPKTATVADVIVMYHKYRIAVVGSIKQDPVSIGNTLFNLATALVKINAPSKTPSIIQTSIQLAIVALKAEYSVRKVENETDYICGGGLSVDDCIELGASG